MIQAQRVEQCRVEIVDPHFILHRFVAKVVGRSMNMAFLESAPSEPKRKRPAIMIPAILSLVVIYLQFSRSK